MSVDAPYTVLGPTPSPSPPSSGTGDVGLVRLLFEFAMIRVGPPWLRRTVGGAIMRSLGVPVDVEVDRNVEGVESRFPGGRDGATIHPTALALIGIERRILRGPGELDETYAARLRLWWDSHRTRGSAYALLAQLHAFFEATNNVPISYVANSGTSAQVDPSGVISRIDVVTPTWSGDGEYPTKWARFFVFFELDDESLEMALSTEGGETITTEDGEAVLVSVAIDALTQTEIDVLCSVPREWSAAHIDRIYLVLFATGSYFWGYPASLTWGGGGLTWGGGGTPVTITC